ncbi:MAG: tyrosine-type recombinase/integrase [Armatimonadetes bacterium]|nr:tyrosine-type recombinase/integrase [Armatimonadota bacterium]
MDQVIDMLAIDPRSGDVRRGAESGESARSLYLQHLRAVRRLCPNTLAAYDSDIRHFLRWCEEKQPIAGAGQVAPALLMDYIASQAELSPNTIRRRVHALSGWFGYLVKRGELESNPCDELPLPKRARAERKCPSPQEVASILVAAKTPLEKAIAYLLAGAGLRRAELLSLEVGETPGDLAEITVRGKGNKFRQIPLPVTVKQVLHEYLAARGTAPGPLIITRKGTRLGTTALRRIFERLLRRAGLADRGYSLHSMRHAYATSLIRAGVDLGTVMSLMGHSDISVTSVYVHSDVKSKRKAVELLRLGAGAGEGDE